MTWKFENYMDRCKPSDPALDYCLWPYVRPNAEANYALRTSTLLYHSFHVAGVSERMIGVCEAIRKAFGRFNVVWGIKWAGERLSWEFYFYDYKRADRVNGVADFIKATEGFLHCHLVPDDSKPYFMFSVEFDDRHANGERDIEQIDIYMGNPGSSVSSGICYGLNASGYEMRNFYFFFDAEAERKAIINKLAETIYLPFQEKTIDQLIWPEMAGVKTIVIANKRHRDSLYFSRIEVGQLILFMDRLNFPKAMISFVNKNKGSFAHHLFDVGYDYDISEDGQSLIYQKGGYYGLL